MIMNFMDKKPTLKEDVYIILNGAEIGNNTIVGAGSLVTQNKKFEDGVLILGNPARVVRNLTEEEIKTNNRSCIEYIELSKKIKA